MTLPASRRQFLQSTALLSAAALGGVGSSLTCKPAAAIEPIQRNGHYKFKFSLAAYSYRSFLAGSGQQEPVNTGAPEPRMSMEDFIGECARMQLDATELIAYYMPEKVTTAYLRKLKGLAFRLGLDISSFCIRNEFSSVDKDYRAKQIAEVKGWIDRVDLLGAPIIRIFSGKVDEQHGQSLDEAYSQVIDGIEECCAYAGERGIYLALENHGGLSATPDGILRIIKAVKSPWFGINWDTGNFKSADVYADLAKIAPYALTMQTKAKITVLAGPDPKKDREVRSSDFKRLAQLLRDVNYRGYIVLEYEETEDPRTACPKLIEQLREAFV